MLSSFPMRMTYSASTYGDEIAEVYDLLHGDHDPAAVATLAELAGDGPVLELGIGTGRLALPLRHRGVSVRGIDASEAMIAKLRSKPGGADVAVTIGDFSSVMLDEAFAVTFVAFNTFFNLFAAEDQVRCFRNVASMLRPGGVFVIEAFVPDLGALTAGSALPYHASSPQQCGLRQQSLTPRIRSSTLNSCGFRQTACACFRSVSDTHGPLNLT